MTLKLTKKNESEVDNIEKRIRMYEEGNFEGKTREMIKYEEETGKYAIWRGMITESFKAWLRGEKIYSHDKERISLYVAEETKDKWLDFLENSDLKTVSKLVRKSVNTYIDRSNNKRINDSFMRKVPQTISRLSHSLKEPLTNIKAGAQLIIENFNKDLNENILATIHNIFDQSLILERKIVNILDDIKTETTKYDILLIDDDMSTIKLLTTYFESKGYICKGVLSGKKGLEELKNSKPSVILLDIIIPDLSGYEICKRIKSDNKNKNIPVYFLTVIASSEVEKKLDETRADGFILKPFNLSDFDPILELIKKDN
jgi:CheY-like chemotaxis protein